MTFKVYICMYACGLWFHANNSLYGSTYNSTGTQNNFLEHSFKLIILYESVLMDLNIIMR